VLWVTISDPIQTYLGMGSALRRARGSAWDRWPPPLRKTGQNRAIAHLREVWPRPVLVCRVPDRGEALTGPAMEAPRSVSLSGPSRSGSTSPPDGWTARSRSAWSPRSRTALCGPPVRPLSPSDS